MLTGTILILFRLHSSLRRFEDRMPVARRSAGLQGAALGERLKKGELAEAMGRSRGGRTSKIHALADDRGGPVAFDWRAAMLGGAIS
jgi:hypothetical protein